MLNKRSSLKSPFVSFTREDPVLMGDQERTLLTVNNARSYTPKGVSGSVTLDLNIKVDVKRVNVASSGTLGSVNTP